jgi:hypothetical protein
VAGKLPAEARAQSSPTTAPVPDQVAGEDADPARPIVWSVREEFYNLPGDSWTNLLILRSDRAFFQKKPRLGGKRGWLTRLDVPLAVNRRPDETRAGLGDIYAQVLYFPYLTPKFGFAAGSGLSIPTATNDRLGTGKLTLAPVVAPIWFFPKRGFFFVKLQDYFSVAGKQDRADLHYFTTTPLLVWRVRRKWWVQFDSEAKTNFQASGHTGFKSGFLIGRVVKGKMGVWVKPEVGWGRYREADFAIKTSFFRVRTQEKDKKRDRDPSSSPK